MKISTRDPLTGKYACANCGGIQCKCTDAARIDAVNALLQQLGRIILEIRVLIPPKQNVPETHVSDSGLPPGVDPDGVTNPRSRR